MSFADELRMVHINTILDYQKHRIEVLEKVVKAYIFAHGVIVSTSQGIKGGN